jgi:4-hydroxy-3-methylbut-2-en-1-yl diphosphate synthase IspG/GcpE
MAVEEQTGKRKPPTPIKGVEYEWLAEDKLCQECGRLVLENQLVVRRNARGKTFEHILPLKHGICLNCGANGLSEMSVAQYEKVLKQIGNYEALKDKKEITEQEEKHMRLLERYIESLQEFCEELSDFVTYTEESGVAYYDDQLEDTDE